MRCTIPHPNGRVCEPGCEICETCGFNIDVVAFRDQLLFEEGFTVIDGKAFLYLGNPDNLPMKAERGVHIE